MVPEREADASFPPSLPGFQSLVSCCMLRTGAFWGAARVRRGCRLCSHPTRQLCHPAGVRSTTKCPSRAHFPPPQLARVVTPTSIKGNPQPEHAPLKQERAVAGTRGGAPWRHGSWEGCGGWAVCAPPHRAPRSPLCLCRHGPEAARWGSRAGAAEGVWLLCARSLAARVQGSEREVSACLLFLGLPLITAAEETLA